jgi:hypothetical protein
MAPRHQFPFTAGRHRLAFLIACVLCAAVPARPAAPIEARPLAAPTHPRGATMFATLDPAAIGIVTENNFADPRMWGDLYQEFALGSMGTGIAIADYDRDGRPDVFVVSKTETSRLFRNLGNWRFEDVTARAGLAGAEASAGLSAWKQGAVFADVNNDGWLDLFVARFATPNLLYINQGDGTFREEAAARGLAVRDACGTGAFCDYDRDGWLDVYVQTNMLQATAHPDGQRDYLFRNNGDGTFTDVTARAGIAGETLAHSAIWWDFDPDGWPDIYAANDFGPPDALYHNNGDGTFTNVIDSVTQHTPYSSMGADLGDVNNDGLVDYFVADMATTTHEKDHRGMASARALSREMDNRPGAAPQYLRNALHLNTGTGVFQEAAILAGIEATDWTWSVRFEDLDNDGRLDLHVTNGMNREHQNSDLRERIIVASSIEERMRLMRESPVLAEPNLAYRGHGDPAGAPRFEDVSAAWGLGHVGVSFGAAFGDLDGDGDLDLVFSNYQAPATIVRNDSDSGHRVLFSLRGTRSNRYGVGSLVRIETASGVQVRPLVLSRGYLSSSEPVLHFGLGTDERITRVEVSWPSGHVQTLHDLAAGHHYTITEPDTPATPGPVGLPPLAGQFAEIGATRGLALAAQEHPRPETSRQPLMPMTFHRRGPGLAVGDVDGDGHEDLLISGASRDPARLVAGISGSASAKPRISPIVTEPNVPDGPALLFDADADGDLDALLTKTGAAIPAGSPRLAARLQLNDGTGTLAPAPEGLFPPVSISAGAVAAADFDRDGRLDVFVGARVLPGRYPSAPRSALLANRAGGFQDMIASLAPTLAEVGMVTSALWTDVDVDGWPDLIVALEWGGVRYFRNDAGRAFVDLSETAGFAAAGKGWWTSLAAADFNGDGRLDYAAGNQGLNSIYAASPERPALLFQGSFADTQARQLVEGYYEGDRLLPRHTLKALGEAVPPVRRRFKKFDDYARATLEEILGADKLAAANRFEATEFRSGVFLSQPDGRFRFQPLPDAAQISVVQGIVAGDLDGDGRADLCVVHNSYSPVHAIGRFDGGIGQLFHGDGTGNLATVEPRLSGLVVPGDAKALVTLDFDEDGAPDLLCSRNNSTTLAFQNRLPPDRHFLRVALRGPAGNPTAIGARVVLRHADRATQTSEIAAGSGYWSQSSAACFFGYTEANPPAAVEVRWPSGASTRHEVAAGATRMTISAP